MAKSQTFNIVWIIVLLVGLLTACNNKEDTLPTLVSIASHAPSVPTDTATEQIVSAVPTLPPTWTVTPSPSLSPTISLTPSLTITYTPTYTPTITPSTTPEPVALNMLAQLALLVTPMATNPIPPVAQLSPPTAVPFGSTPTPASGLATQLPATQCTYLPSGGFGQIIINEPNLVTQIGCPLGEPPVTSSYSGAFQTFEHGIMVWLNEMSPFIYVFYDNGSFQRFDDTFDSNIDPESGGETPPGGLLEPVRGFGKVWRTFTLVRGNLGWATTGEAADNAVVLEFTQGRMLYLTSRQDIFVITYQGNTSIGIWRAVPGSF